MKNIMLAAAAALALGSAASAEPFGTVTVDGGENDIGFGLGISWAFGATTAKQGLSVGLKAFSQRKQDSLAASAGVDYNFTSGAFRPNVGVAQLFNDAFIDLNYGYDFGGAGWGFGMTSGYTETAKSYTYTVSPR